MDEEVTLSPKTKAVLFEICKALQRFADTGETWSIFINKISLVAEERQVVRDFLGQGNITIHLSDSAEPAEWMESGISGIWYGVFYDHTKNPILETIEIGKFPQVASSQREDIHRGLKELELRLSKNTE
jgi:hypothetical protein